MSLLSNLISFGVGVVAANYVIPKVSESLEKIKLDTKEILHDENLIKQMCIDQIAKWYYEGNLDSAIKNAIQERTNLSDEAKAKLNDLRNGTPIWPNPSK